LIHLNEVPLPDIAPRWLLLIHSLPTHPAYFRVKTLRQLQGLGAVALKNSIYVLPAGEQSLEDFQWMLRQITSGGGEASVVQAEFVEGVSDDEVRELFKTARGEDYDKLNLEIRAQLKALPKALDDAARSEAEGQLVRFRKRLAEIQELDFFEAPARAHVEESLSTLEARLLPAAFTKTEEARLRLRDLQGRTWVTRKGIHVDRIACAWLIRRFIEPGARIRFVDPKAYKHRKGEQRFDMFEGEFTHEGDACSFETLLSRLHLSEPGLKALAELIHDVDLKDHKFKRPETEGFARAIQGVALLHAKDEARLEAGSVVLDVFFEAMKRGSK
jgi:hypothetical protein